MFRRTETMSIKEFMNPEPKSKVDVTKYSSLWPLGVIGWLPAFGSPAYAHAPEAVPVVAGPIKEQIIHAFDPLIDLIISLSYPVAGVMIAAGSLFVMIGSRDKGLGMIQMAALGYVLVQLSPLMMELLVQVGNAV